MAFTLQRFRPDRLAVRGNEPWILSPRAMDVEAPTIIVVAALSNEALHLFALNLTRQLLALATLPPILQQV